MKHAQSVFHVQHLGDLASLVLLQQHLQHDVTFCACMGRDKDPPGIFDLEVQ